MTRPESVGVTDLVEDRLSRGQRFNAYEGHRSGWQVGIGPVTDFLGIASVRTKAVADWLVDRLATSSTVPVGEGRSAIVEWVLELASRDIRREQTDFIGRMHQAMGDFEAVCDDHPDGDWPEQTRDDAGESLAALAGLALAQLAMVSSPADPLSALASRSPSPLEGEREGLERAAAIADDHAVSYAAMAQVEPDKLTSASLEIVVAAAKAIAKRIRTALQDQSHD